MMESTLGLIETYGFIGAVEALDTALKTADVKFVGCEFVKGGIVTILITGDVASVKVAIEASSIAADKLGALLNAHVIARAGEGVWNMVKSKKNPCNKLGKPMSDKNISSRKAEKDKTEAPIEEEAEKTKNEVVIKAEDLTYTTRQELEKYKVPELRTMARACKNISLTKEQIKFSKKEQLIEAILMDAGRRDD